jgi:hypothetical protein
MRLKGARVERVLWVGEVGEGVEVCVEVWC